MAKMQVDEKTVENAIKLCQNIGFEIMLLRKKYYQTSQGIMKKWNDEKFKEVKKEIEEDFEALEKVDKSIEMLEVKLEKIKQFIHEYYEAV